MFNSDRKKAFDKLRILTKDLCLDLTGINKRVCYYIEDVLRLIKKEIGLHKIRSIFLFGSQIPQNSEESNISDCDLLIIFDNDVSKKSIQHLEKFFISLEIKHNFRDEDSSFMKKLLGDIQYHTGIFKSHFFSTEKSWKRGKFHKIFNVNYLFSKLLAPKRLVLGSVIKNSNLLYGEDLRGKIEDKIKITSFDITKSLIMNSLLSFFSFIIAPFESLSSIKYQLEAVKWSLRASDYYLFESTDTLVRVINRIKILKKTNYKQNDQEFYKKFIFLRNHPRSAYIFMFKSFLKIFKIHLTAIHYKKELRDFRT
ncbi:MAG: hypothetical protein BAJALOKI2v1_870005 [Promethearchaeota archaeon]|nr:MAG: hypothetical protein BAJALOKI2v1_870005 [Candidatus Lokiarchaeota archaeon]